ncbi:Gfo/Idh/MocA family protein [Nonomuraea sp. M3C6]|uniref:Gfo/Idh/MocA family protein n=1 Tax=Nonomuraea marmarensis TaxID=3351344 RepID=A0ABW7AI09_9ACTN
MADVLRFGVVGLSSDHVWHLLDALRRQDGVEVVAVAEPSPALRERAATEIPGVTGHESAGQLLDCGSLDAVLVCCDNAAKAVVVPAALARGIAVYQDKPLAATVAQASAIAKALAEHGGTLMCAWHTVFDPLYDEVGELVRGGLIGDVRFARGLAGHAGLTGLGVSGDFRAWLTDPERGGGGSFVDQAGYVLTAFADYVGPVRRISGFGGRIDPGLPARIEDNTAAIVEFESGALGSVDTRWGQIGPLPLRYAFHGGKGTVSCFYDRWEIVTEAARLDGWDPMPAPPGLHGFRRAVQPRSGYDDEARYFVEHLRSGEPMKRAVSVESALHVQSMIAAYYASVEQGTAQLVDPAP